MVYFAEPISASPKDIREVEGANFTVESTLSPQDLRLFHFDNLTAPFTPQMLNKALVPLADEVRLIGIGEFIFSA